MTRWWMCIACAGLAAASCGDEGDAAPPPPAACDAPADFVLAWGDAALAASRCGPLGQSELAVRDGAAYFATEKGICLADAGGPRLLAEHPLGHPTGGPWITADGLLVFADVAALLFPIQGGDPTVVATVAGTDLDPSQMAAAYDGRFVYGAEVLGFPGPGALWRIERDGMPQILSHLELEDGERDILQRIVPAADHVDTSGRYGKKFFRTDLATGISRVLFNGSGPTYLLGGDGDSIYVRDAVSPLADPTAYWSDRNMALFRIDGAGVETRVLDVQTPLVPTAVTSTAERSYAAGKLAYSGRIPHHGVVALTPSGMGAELLACVPAPPGEYYSSLDTVMAITVEGDFVYALLTDQARTPAIVRVAR
jgi:hypothetical protein